jgi:hypothetical protein
MRPVHTAAASGLPAAPMLVLAPAFSEGLTSRPVPYRPVHLQGPMTAVTEDRTGELDASLV